MSEHATSGDVPVMFEEIGAGLGLITMNRPAKLNAINMNFIDAFDEALNRVRKREDIRVLVLTGAGRGFCSGADLSEAMSEEAREVFASPSSFLAKVQERYSGMILGLRAIPQPVIAAVNGPAAGGGFALALASDIRLASPGAYFVASFVNIGLSAGEMGTSFFLPRLVGMSRAAEILFTGRKVQAAEAEHIGLVSKVIPGDTLLDEAKTLAQVLLQKSPVGLLLTKRVLDQNACAPSLEAAAELENRNQTVCVTSSALLKQATAFST